MRKFPRFLATSSPLLGALLGIVFYFCVFGGGPLKPTSIDWQLDRDEAQHYLGWEFFRYESWHFPPGKIEGYGTPDGSSITYTDSIPVMAFGFKLLRGLLPHPFQYTGLWMLLCYGLQGAFGWLLASLATKSALSRALVTTLFIVSPALLNRSLGHHALMAHWLLLGALYLGLQNQASFRARHPRLKHTWCWAGLCALAAAVHLYLLAMVLTLYLASAVADLLRQPVRAFGGYLTLLAPLALSGAVLYLVGAFQVSAKDWGANDGMFGAFSMNLLAPLVPGCLGSPSESAYVSRFVTATPFPTRAMGLFEGFNYLGLGALVLMLVGASIGLESAFVRRRPKRRTKRAAPEERLGATPLLVAALLMGGYSLSNAVMLGTRNIVSLPLSGNLAYFTGIFRASGRFFWPLGYLLPWLAALALSQRARKHQTLGTAALGVCVALQLLDLSGFFGYFAATHRSAAHYTSPLRSAFWSDAAKRYRQILYYPPSDTSYYVPLGLLAAPHAMGMNVAYKARTNSDLAEQAERALARDLESGNLQANTLYVFKDESIYGSLQSKLSRPEFILTQVDDLYVAARVRASE